MSMLRNLVYPDTSARTAVGVAVYRISDGKFFDFSGIGGTPHQFTAGPPTGLTLPLAKSTILPVWAAAYDTTALLAQFTDDWYYYLFCDTASTPALLSTSINELKSGNDIFGSVGSDPLSTAVPGSYNAGTAGAALGAISGVPAAVWAAVSRTLTSGSSGGDLLSGAVVDESTRLRVIVSGYEAGNTYIGQTLRHEPSVERRKIAGQSVQGDNYVFTFGNGVGLEGPFTNDPTAGDQITIC